MLSCNKKEVECVYVVKPSYQEGRNECIVLNFKEIMYYSKIVRNIKGSDSDKHLVKLYQKIYVTQNIDKSFDVFQLFLP